MGLKNRFDEAARRNDVKAIVLTGNLYDLFGWPICDDLFIYFKMVALLYTAIEDSLIVNLLISGKGGRFSGGFDISVMQKVHQTGKLWSHTSV